MNFEQRRANLSHYVLRNGTFSRISVPAGMWDQQSVPREERIQRLIEGWPELVNKPESLACVYGLWFGSPTVRESTMKFHEAAFKLNDWIPAKAFPGVLQVEQWLDHLEYVINRFNNPKKTAKLNSEHVNNFWGSGLDMLEWVDSCRLGAPRLRELFSQREVTP
jgi:hypothetical protein